MDSFVNVINEKISSISNEIISKKKSLLKYENELKSLNIYLKIASEIGKSEDEIKYIYKDIDSCEMMIEHFNNKLKELDKHLTAYQ